MGSLREQYKKASLIRRLKRLKDQRFIVRGKHNRRVANTSVKLLEDLSNLKPIGSYAIEIAQKSKRKKRVVELEIMAKQVTFIPAERNSKVLAIDLRPITLKVVIVSFRYRRNIRMDVINNRADNKL